MTGGRDLELNELHRGGSHAEGSSFTVYGHGAHEEKEGDFRRPFGRFVDSFRREEVSRFSADDDQPPLDNGFGTPGVHVAREHRGGRYYDIRTATAKTANSLLTRELKGRHLQMIAIGGSIGTGLFVASGKTLSQGGPASVLLAYLTIGCMLYCTVQALGEMAVVFPVAGSFSAYSTRFLDPSWGFAMGWK
jgi:yeast amino acid transporter